ncbi:uncharacterized protein LOC9327148 [Arabidopsis lyrata subsp. lyrata]|uniref:uncharacterized protein LOC9327148 n=1 Tax=Arabidopsis lyrata subsp. lyrata TaxID=81972 RepID=UPI000A29D21D|nr:uncharacterized protein LOC9327148 [Arabidopsis lyrata subsp. lyrata]|eukprot:XP_020869496.1 uncharacterized protein LOC9327148 [Arabidopsis lyrata subsp. lyrata]
MMKILGQKAKNHKNLLWNKHKRDTLEESIENRPKNISEEEWQDFVHLQFTEKIKILRKRNTESSHHKTPHKLGKKSIARKSKEDLIKTGKRPSREANGDKSVAVRKKKKIIGVESIRNVPISSSSSPRQNPKDDQTILLMSLHQANDKIATLEESQAAYQQKMQAKLDHYEHLFDIIANRDPTVEVALKEKRRQQELQQANN